MPNYALAGLLIAALGVIIYNSRRIGRLEGKMALLCRLVKLANGIKEEDDE